MRERIEGIVLGVIFGLLGAWMSLVGAGIFKTSLPGMQGPGQVVGGLMFFFAGAWSFFQSTLGFGGQNLTIYRWIQFLMVLPILAGLGIFLLISGMEAGEISATLLGILPLLGALWYALARFPGNRKKP
jgi:hypothetical protein